MTSEFCVIEMQRLLQRLKKKNYIILLCGVSMAFFQVIPSCSILVGPKFTFLKRKKKTIDWCLPTAGKWALENWWKSFFGAGFLTLSTLPAADIWGRWFSALRVWWGGGAVLCVVGISCSVPGLCPLDPVESPSLQLWQTKINVSRYQICTFRL